MKTEEFNSPRPRVNAILFRLQTDASAAKGVSGPNIRQAGIIKVREIEDAAKVLRAQLVK